MTYYIIGDLERSPLVNGERKTNLIMTEELDIFIEYEYVLHRMKLC